MTRSNSLFVTATLLLVALLLISCQFISLPLQGDCFWASEAYIWLDSNENGLWDNDEQPLSNVLIYIDDPLNDLEKVSENTSGPDGRADLTVWLPGCPKTQFEVYAMPPQGYIATTDAIIQPQDEDTSIYFGFKYDENAQVYLPSQDNKLECSFRGESKQVSDMKITGSGEVWVSTQKDLWRFLPNNETLRYTIASGLTDQDIRALAVGKDDSIWLATRKGVQRFQHETFATYKASSDDLRVNNFMDVAVSQDGLVWLGTHSVGIVQYDPQSNRWKQFDEADGFPGSFRPNFIETPNGTIWFVVWGKVYEANKVQNDGYKWTLVANGINSSPLDSWWSDDVHVSPDGKLWFRGRLSDLNAIASFDPITSTWKTYDFQSTNGVMFGSFLFDIAVGPDGSIWLGSTHNGLMRLIPGNNAESDRWELYDERNGLPDNNINHIVLEKDGTLWLAHKQGISSCNIVTGPG